MSDSGQLRESLRSSFLTGRKAEELEKVVKAGLQRA